MTPQSATHYQELIESGRRLSSEYAAAGNSSFAWYFSQYADAIEELTAPAKIPVSTDSVVEQKQPLERAEDAGSSPVAVHHFAKLAFSIKTDGEWWYIHGEELVPGLNVVSKDFWKILADVIPVWAALHRYAPKQVPPPPSFPSETREPVNNDLTRLIDKMHTVILDTDCSGRPTGDLFDVWMALKAKIEPSFPSATLPMAEVERLKEALRQVKAFVVGEKIPNWAEDWAVYATRGKIADICDFALAHPHHPRDIHLTVEKR